MSGGPWSFAGATPLDAELALALRAAARGAELAREGAGGALRAERKSLGDYVTEVDRRIDAAIAAILAHTDLRIVSEELHPLDPGEPLPDDCWIVDPLDGSNAYIVGARRELVSCMLALRLGGETELAVLHFPFSDEVVFAGRGHGAYRGAERLRVDPRIELADSWIALNHYGDLQLETDRFAALARALRGPRGAMLVTVDPPGSGLALSMLGAGNRLGAVLHDNNPRRRKQEIWDVIPPRLVLEEAGAVFLDGGGRRYRPESCELVLAARSRRLAETILALA
ncbi:MAG: hypothetical protein H6807_16550 [Planctomycetes bacterium]|nr:hypothetical protein [Planctomycetota bacterium]